MSSRVLVVDDDPVQRRLLEEATRKFGHTAIAVESGEKAVDALTGADGAAIDLVILDLVMPDLDGMAVMERLNKAGIVKPIIVQTAHGGIETVVTAMRAGAFDFVVKPVSPERLQVSITNALKVNALESEVTRIKRQANGTLTFKNLVTRSENMARVIHLGERAAGSNIPILIEGESGVGKEVIARAIQGSSERKTRPFVTVNCGAIPENLVESILFGHEKGAFTGATEKHTGKFVEANGGTLFLDEVGELPPNAQVKLLRALQEGEVDPVGARKSIKVDFRLISATNKDMIELVKNGQFREDLYYRLNVFPVFVPPLRDRKDDIPDLARHFMARFAAEEGKKVNAISPNAVALLQAYAWPGNVRQLENAMFRAVVLCDGAELGVREFPQIAAQIDGYDAMIADLASDSMAEAAAASAAAALPSGATAPTPINAPQAQPEAPVSHYGQMPLFNDEGHMRTLEDLEEAAIRMALDRYSGRMSEVARRLGIGRSTLYRKIADYGLQESA
ncbi:MAG: sigma-54 dependent transcriptional regulator [Pseudomonadota bacterium]